MMLSLLYPRKSNGCTAARQKHKQATWKEMFFAQMGRTVRKLIYGPPRLGRPDQIPTASTIAPPSTIWNTACMNGVSMYRARI